MNNNFEQSYLTVEDSLILFRNSAYKGRNGWVDLSLSAFKKYGKERLETRMKDMVGETYRGLLLKCDDEMFEESGRNLPVACYGFGHHDTIQGFFKSGGDYVGNILFLEGGGEEEVLAFYNSRHFHSSDKKKMKCTEFLLGSAKCYMVISDAEEKLVQKVLLPTVANNIETCIAVRDMEKWNFTKERSNNPKLWAIPFSWSQAICEGKTKVFLNYGIKKEDFLYE